jgi:cytoskeleton protein RodZ
MSDKPTNEEDTQPAEALAGLRLAAARRSLGISVLEIAKELHLDEPKVRALEENDFDALGAPVFAKGHLRKYAELVGVATDDVLADYYGLNRAVGAPPVVGLAHKAPREYHLGRWVAGFFITAIIAAVALGAYWWLELRAENAAAQSDTPTLAPFVSASRDGIEAATDSTSALEVAENTETSAGPGIIDQDDTEPESLELPVDAVMDEFLGEKSDLPQVTLSVSFSGDCWTEVSDESGKRLFFDLGKEGRTVSITGAAPLRALFGDSSNVRLEVDGQDYPITNSMRSGQTARMTINAQ